MKTFSVDGLGSSTLDEIIKDNDGELVQSEIEMIDSLEVGESCYVGIVEIKRFD